ncbi:diacylglycerol/lipid kinase family protein [Blastococcus sp. SYSU D00820]
MRELLAVVNGAAGSADDESVQAALAGLRAGADVRVVRTADEADLARAVAGRGGRRLVVLGGDGSVHAAVRALDRAGQLDPGDPVGIVPCGTGNDLARALDLPLDPVEGAEVVLTGTPRAVDVVRDDAGEPVLNAVHVGIGAHAYDRATRFKKLLGPAAFPLGAALAGVTTTSWDLRVEVDGEVVTTADGGWCADGRTGVLLVAVCNGPTIGGGRPLAPSAVLDDGLADVVVCVATGPVARAAFGVALARGRHADRRDVVITRGREVTVSGGPVQPDADGELQAAVTARTWRMEHRAWSVLVPS